MFTLCIENGTRKRYLIGFQVPGAVPSPVTVKQLFDGDIGEIEDCDVLLVDDPGRYGESEAPHHRCQLTSYLGQPSTSEADFVNFLESKKLRVARDSDLRLVIHIEQGGFVNHASLSGHLNHRSPRCPYSQVFVFGQTATEPRRWSCAQVYPDLVTLPELDEETAKALILDREQYNRFCETSTR